MNPEKLQIYILFIVVDSVCHQSEAGCKPFQKKQKLSYFAYLLKHEDLRSVVEAGKAVLLVEIDFTLLLPVPVGACCKVAFLFPPLAGTFPMATQVFPAEAEGGQIEVSVNRINNLRV